MTHNDYEKSISSILEIITKNADKLRVPTTEEERKSNKRMLHVTDFSLIVKFAELGS